MVFSDSSTVEWQAVNLLVVGSNPTLGTMDNDKIEKVLESDRVYLDLITKLSKLTVEIGNETLTPSVKTNMLLVNLFNQQTAIAGLIFNTNTLLADLNRK